MSSTKSETKQYCCSVLIFGKIYLQTGVSKVGQVEVVVKHVEIHKQMSAAKTITIM